jgi:protein-tyrosine phosphatase
MIMFLLVSTIALIISLTKASNRVTEEQCQKIRERASYWKPDPIAPYNDADFIVFGVYLGNVCAAHNDTWLEEESITAVISVSSEWSVLPYCGNREITFHHYPLDDVTTLDRDKTKRVFKEVAYLINDLIQTGGPDVKILVHCNMGISRSASVVLWYIQHYLLSLQPYDRIERLVRIKRPVVTPNRLFRSILQSED